MTNSKNCLTHEQYHLKSHGKPLVLDNNVLLHSLAALAATFSAVAFYCYLKLIDAKPLPK